MFTKGSEKNVVPIIPDEDSSLSSLLTNQSNLRENWVQLVLFPRISAAEQRTKVLQGFIKRFGKIKSVVSLTSLVHLEISNCEVRYPMLYRGLRCVPSCPFCHSGDIKKSPYYFTVTISTIRIQGHWTDNA